MIYYELKAHIKHKIAEAFCTGSIGRRTLQKPEVMNSTMV